MKNTENAGSLRVAPEVDAGQPPSSIAICRGRGLRYKSEAGEPFICPKVDPAKPGRYGSTMLNDPYDSFC